MKTRTLVSILKNSIRKQLGVIVLMTVILLLSMPSILYAVVWKITIHLYNHTDYDLEWSESEYFELDSPSGIVKAHEKGIIYYYIDFPGRVEIAIRKIERSSYGVMFQILFAPWISNYPPDGRWDLANLYRISIISIPQDTNGRLIYKVEMIGRQ